MIQKIKGTMDILPAEAALFRHIERVMREEAERYGYGEIRTPMFENTELFVRGVGEGTDLVIETAGSEFTCRQAIQMAGKGSTIVLVGYSRTGEMTLPTDFISIP